MMSYEQRLADLDLNGGPITVGGLTFTTTKDCFGEPRWQAGEWVVGKFAQDKWWSRPSWDTEGTQGVTASSREEAMQNCVGRQGSTDRLARWQHYMLTHEPPW